MKFKCVRCHNLREDFRIRGNKRNKTCNRCLAQITNYHKTNGREIYRKVMRRYYCTENGRKRYQQVAERQKNKFPEKFKARTKAMHAIQSGKLKKERCFCGDINAEKHHPDYSRPLFIMWLCKLHHTEIHMKLRGEKSYQI